MPRGFPQYADIEGPLLEEIRRRGGSTRPSDKDSQGRTIYDALADHFNLSREARAASTGESDGYRSKWENMVRWARRKLVAQGRLDRRVLGVWKIKS